MASALLSVTEVKEHVATGLSDTALERVVDGEDAYIRRMAGEHDPAGAMTYVEDRPDYRMSLPRAASAVASVTINYWRQSDRVNSRSTGKSSRRPAIINSESNHLPGHVRAE